MKTIVTTFALSLALCAAAGATAQTWSATPAPAADSALLSETTDGNYIVRRYIVKSHADADYSVRYQINLAKLSSSLDGNNKQLDNLSAFVGDLMKDTLMHVKSAVITGYSSPDGPLKFNEMLARNRAQDFKNYVDKKYNFSKKYNVKINSVAEDWEMCRALVEQSSVPDKAKVLEIIDGKWTSAQKEMALKKMPAAWNYMKVHILPPVRRVELTVNYGEGNIVEQRMMIPKPKPEPAPQPAAQPCCDVVVDEAITGLIVEMPGSETDFKKMDKQVAKQVTTADKLVNKESRVADKLAKKEAKDAAKIAKKADKEAHKMAKAVAKAAKKAEKAAAKAAKKMM